MEHMEQQYDLSELIRQQPGPEVFKRVWDRVMPDQKDSPLVLAPLPQKEETAAFAPQPASAPETPPPPAPEEEPALCLGDASQGDVEALTELMVRARENLAAGQVLARRSGGRSLSALAADHRRALRQLSAARFLITGKPFRPEGKAAVLPASLPLALREQFVREQRWERTCQAAARSAADPCLRELYRELAQDGALHAGEIRSLLENSLTSLGILR